MILMNFINENCSNFVRNMGEALLDNFSRTSDFVSSYPGVALLCRLPRVIDIYPLRGI
jgi:hypothetical protein